MMRTKGLYIHIPFCVKKCDYCDFLSFPWNDRAMYIRSLIREMELRTTWEWNKKLVGKDTFAVDTIFIGGGTPSVLTVPEMDLVFQGIQDCFCLNELKEFTIECNPGTVTEEKLRLYRQAGVNRISFGMQSAVDCELKALGRIHTFHEFELSYELARSIGFDNINVDVMFAIPGQTKESYEYTLSAVAEREPEHISSYSLIVEEGTPFFEKYADNPPVDDDTDRFMYERTKEFLAENGYERYEISNYAQKGKECQHNLKYWRREDYLGLGLGAASFMNHERFSNVRSMKQYIDRITEQSFPVDEASIEKLSTADERAEFMFLGLRCMKGVSMEDFKRCFGEEMMVCYKEEITSCIEQGLLEREGYRLRLTPRGIDVSNRVFSLFL